MCQKADLHELGVQIVEVEKVGLVGAELRHSRALLLYFRQLCRNGCRVKMLLAHQLVGMVAQRRHLLLLARHQVLEGVVGLQVRLHFLYGGAAVSVRESDLLQFKRDFLSLVFQ